MPSLDHRRAFEADSSFSGQLLREPARCFLIPSYQRSFSWDNENLAQLIRDIVHGVENLTKYESATTFLGTLITSDYRNPDLGNQIRAQIPSGVLVVVDGQQRLTAIMLTHAVLHHKIDTMQRKVCTGEDEAVKWLDSKCEETCNYLLSTLQADMGAGTGDYRHFPRLIREYTDCWAREQKDALYKSPIASFLHEYGSQARSEDAGGFRLEKDNPLRTAYNRIGKLIDEAVSDEIDEEDSVLSIFDHADNPNVHVALFGDQLPSSVSERASLNYGRTRDPEYSKLVRLLVIARFALERLALVVVTAHTEDHAFDVFESLNTTGEPLTAYETFKPLVIRHVGVKSFQTSAQKVEMDSIEAYLQAPSTARQRQSLATNLLVSFALAETGKKLSRHLSEQRHYLRDEFNSLGDEQKNEFVNLLSKTVSVRREIWDWKPTEAHMRNLDGVVLSEIDQICLDVLKQCNHEITLGPLSRVYSYVRDSGDIAVGDVVRAMVAFSCLWRAATGTTAGIESRYRELMSSGMTDAESDTRVPALSRRPKGQDLGLMPSIDLLQRFFIAHLRELGIGDKQSWIEVAKSVSLYDHNAPLTRFVLFMALNDSEPDPDNEGMVRRGLRDSLPLLTFARWTSDMTIEHVAPSRPEKGHLWDGNLYSVTRPIDRVGNLLLLPNADNASISNRSWREKQACYYVLAAATKDERATRIRQVAVDGVKLPDGIAKNDAFRPFVAGVSGYEGLWDLEFINRRSECLLGLAWDGLAPWLGVRSG